jgi:uncharacterized protein DUF5681
MSRRNNTGSPDAGTHREPVNGDYKVGYGRPPIEHQFKPGQPSANPSGRPKTPNTIGSMVQRALSRRISVVENGVRKRRRLEEVIFDSLANKAARGDLRAAQLLLQFKARYQDVDERQGASATELAEEDRKLLDVYLDEQQGCCSRKDGSGS